MSNVPFTWDDDNKDFVRYCQTGNHKILPKMKEGTTISGGSKKTSKANNIAVQSYLKRTKPITVKSKKLKEFGFVEKKSIIGLNS